MESYKSEAKYHVKGKGDVYIVKNKEDFPKGEFPHSEVSIDNKHYKVLGVETFAVQKILKGWFIGICVK